MRKALRLVSVGALCAGSVFAQQTGSISGKVTTPDGEGLAGVAVEATSSVLPRARTTVTSANGDYRLPLLPPGDYTVTFAMDQMATASRSAQVLLQQETYINVNLSPEVIGEAIEVTGSVPMIDPNSAELKSAVASDVITQLPVGQEYRDLVKLIPGVQYTENAVRGPSAGGSGQDNVYQFDGVNVTLPLFGTLSAEPSSHDIDQISIVKGGAKATDFNRAGGFTINSISKSGTNSFKGEVSYQLQTEGMTADRETTSASIFDEDKDWATASFGGPLVRERLYFYLSYYRPTVDRDNRSNLLGEVLDFDSERNEYFGKFTLTPTDNLLLHLSYRDSDREVTGASVGGRAAASTATGEAATLKIGIAEGSWVLGSSSFASFRLTDFENKTGSRPDNVLSVVPSLAAGARLDLANLDQMGLVSIPLPRTGETAYNEFIAPLIERYGALVNGVRVGDVSIGAGSTINDQDFFREAIEVGYDFTLGDNVIHEIHTGYQYSSDVEELARLSNGWGLITIPGGRTSRNGTPIFFEAVFQQMGTLGGDTALIDPIESEYESHNIEINDTIRLKHFTISAGLLVSNDILYGQGLREDPSTISGYVAAPGNKYEMYELEWEDMLQPRLSATWSPNSRDAVFLSYARYLPAASSLPRAASWARNTVGQTVRAYFDANGNLFDSEQVGSSSGKLFVEDLDPRTTDEISLGYSKQIRSNWSATVSGRYRKSYNFWEDTNNNARVNFLPPEGVPRELYIPDLSARLAQIGSGSSYVIAELDLAENKYYEVNLETEWRGKKAFVKGSYVWSHYYGNMDQDNTSFTNDLPIFIGSSNIADAAGRQLWDNKYGNLGGDRRHKFKVYGYYDLTWNASIGAFAIFQSGQPWEAWDSNVYRALTSSTSDTIRFAEPAGSRTTSDHYQLDLNYTQNFPFGGRYNAQLRLDVFNVFDKQTGYNPEPSVNSADFGQSRSFFAPRRYQVGVKFQF